MLEKQEKKKTTVKDIESPKDIMAEVGQPTQASLPISQGNSTGHRPENHIDLGEKV